MAASCEAAPRFDPELLDEPEDEPPAASGVARRDGSGSLESLSQPTPITSSTATRVTAVGAAAGCRTIAVSRARASRGGSVAVALPAVAALPDFAALGGVLSACFPVIAGALPSLAPVNQPAEL